MISLKENLSKLESIKITGFTDNSNFVELDYAFISFSKNLKEALKYSKDAIDKGAIIVISQVNLHEYLKDKNLFDSNLVNHKDKYLETLFARSKKVSRSLELLVQMENLLPHFFFINFYLLKIPMQLY